MGNKNYEKGRRKEYKIVKEYRDKGFRICQRTAGSHSPIDVIAISEDLKEIHLIQAKPDNYAESKVKKLIEQNINLNGEFRVVFKVI